jgi:hypothetical protein
MAVVARMRGGVSFIFVGAEGRGSRLVWNECLRSWNCGEGKLVWMVERWCMSSNTVFEMRKTTSSIQLGDSILQYSLISGV